jgi:hypothetical protein
MKRLPILIIAALTGNPCCPQSPDSGGVTPPASCQANFYFYYNDSIMTFAEAYPYSFVDLSAGDVKKRLWDFGDGQTSEEKNPLHFYSTAGEVREVCLTITTSDGCESSFCDKLITGNVAYCSLTGTVLDYTGLDGCGLVIGLDNGDILEPAEIIPDFKLQAGQRVRLSYTELNDRASICMVGKIVRIDCIEEEPRPGLCEGFIKLNTEIVLNGQTCSGSAAASLVDAAGNAVYAAGFFWSTGETGPVIYNLCPGMTYSVTITDSSDCAVSGSFSFGGGTVFPDSLIGYWNFEQDDMNFYFSIPVYSDSLYCEWDFGDGTTAGGASVNHTYTTEDAYTVTLKVYTPGGEMLFNQQIPVSPGAFSRDRIFTETPPEVYPVPAKDILYVKTQTIPEKIVKIDLLTSNGQVIMSVPAVKQADNLLQLDVSGLPAGFYMGRLTIDDTSVQTFRFVK